MLMKSRVIAVLVALFGLAGSVLAQPVGWFPLVGATGSTAGGFGDADNTGIASSAVHGDFLYVGTQNLQTGTEVWRTLDGFSWDQVNTDGFGAIDNQVSYSMVVFDGDLFVGTWGSPFTGSDTRIWRSSNGTSWTQANTDGFGDSDNAEPWAMLVYKDKLYVGAANYPDGAEMWRTGNGTTWEQRNSNGFGEVANAEISAMAVFDGLLYAATRNFTGGVQMFRSDGSTTWTKVNSNGFGDANNEGAYAMAVFGQRLHVAALNGTDGVEVWSSSNGTGWSQSNASGFGSSDNWGVYAMHADQAELIAGTFNYSGAELWRDGA